MLCVQTNSTQSSSSTPGNELKLTTTHRYAECSGGTCPRPQRSMCKRQQPAVGENLRPSRSLQLYPKQRRKDHGTVIKLEDEWLRRGKKSMVLKKKIREWSLVKITQPKATEWSRDCVKALRWLCNSSCAKVAERDRRDSSWSWVLSTSESLGEEKTHVEGKAICNLPSWKFTPICGEVEHSAPS